MMIHVLLTQYDLLEGTGTVIAEGSGNLSGDTLIYREKAEPFYFHEVNFTDRKITLERKAEIRSVTELVPMGKGTSTVHSPFGKMELTTVLNGWSRQEDTWMVEYKVLSGDETVLHQRLVWELKGAAE
ncbi:MAG: hypothetical protein E7190_03975 [Erysipelotrichaceae bacterium]|nr:hypothetical protein [Erysipelotrichaceae bacterium]